MSSIRSPINRAIREVLFAERDRKGLNQAQFAKAMGRAQSTVSKLETGTRFVRIEEFALLARALGANPGDLLNKALALADVGVSVHKRQARKVTRKATKPE